MRAYDGGVPSNRSVAGTVRVNVNRNLHPPEILNLDADFTINEDDAINVPIFRVEARDNDTTKVCSHISLERRRIIAIFII